MQHHHRRAGARGTRARRHILALSLSTAALLGCASTALADTTVSIENGSFGSGLSGKYLFIRDTVSLFDERMDVNVTRSGGKIFVTDAVGNMHVNGSGCALSGAAASCSDAGIVGLRIEAGTKNDRLTNSTDLVGVVLANKGDDFMQGGSNRDQMNGEQGQDEARGGGGQDVFFSEPGDDVLNGETGGPDTISYSAAPSSVSIDLNDTSGNGVVGEDDRLLGIENARGSAFGDTIIGSDVANTLNGLGGSDHIFGRSGNDRMVGGDGPDDLHGEDGIDAADYVDRTAGVVVDIDGNNDDGNALDGPAGARDNVLTDTENVLGGSGGDTLSGHSLGLVANTLDGNAGDDTLRGRAGDDVLDGDIGNDRLEGEAGADRLVGGIFNDILDGGAGADELLGDAGDDTLDGGPDPDSIDGGLNRDHLTYASRSEDIKVTLDSVALGDDGGASDGPDGQRDDARGVEQVTTGSGKDRVEGDGSDEEFATGAGDDVLIGNAGDDTLDGGFGVDEYRGGLDSDTLNTLDGGVDQPISCGEGPIEDPGADFPSIDEILGDVADLQANPQIVVPGDPAECELRTFK